MSVFLIATLDTKGREIGYVRERLAARGVPTVLLDAGCQGEPGIRADVPREAVFEAAGTTLAAMRSKGDRGEAVTRAAAGAAAIVLRRHAAGEVGGVLAIGGSAGTTIGTAAMRALPIGVPKVMVSTLASGQVRGFVRDKDVFMLNPIVDIAGLNRVSRTVLAEAAAAMAGLFLFRDGDRDEAIAPDRPLVAATMFGVTTPCVERARAALEAGGYEVLVFHATGTGGEAMESLVRDGVFAGVLDITTTEIADELVGGFLTAGKDRLTAAGDARVPQVISVGATDMVNFHGIGTVPEPFRNRKLHRHNDNVTLMRTTPEENARIGADIGKKAAAAARAKCPVAILLPLRGVSSIDREGEAFDDPAARRALFEAIRANARGVEIVEIDAHVNDPAFADAAAKKLLELLSVSKKGN
jgi:uncharacterized protein (UPF0261 family)